MFPTVAPRSSVVLTLPRRLPRVPAGAEVHLDVQWTQRRATAWAPAGHVVGVDQMELDAPVSAGAPTPPPTPSTATVDVGAIEWAPTVFRALTDNDGLKQGWIRGFLGNLDRWVTQQGLDRCVWEPGSTRRRRTDDGVVVTTRGALRAPGVAAPVEVRRRVLVRGDGWSHAVITMRVPTELADPPRVGTEWVLPGELSLVEWFGDGPHECYPDRRSSTTVGRHRSTVDDMYEDYVVPQEHGHRTGVRWLALRGPGRGRRAAPGLLVVADPATGDGTFGMAVRRHRDAELWASTHTDELAAQVAGRAPATFLHLDAGQRGLGTASCGPDTLDRYRLAAGTHTIGAWFRSFAPGADDPAALARAVRAERAGA